MKIRIRTELGNRGVSTIEYALLVALLAVAIVPTVSQVSAGAGNTFLRVNNAGRSWEINGGTQLLSGTNDFGSGDQGGGTWGSIASTVPTDGGNFLASGGDTSRSGNQNSGGSGRSAGDDSGTTSTGSGTAAKKKR